MVGAQQVTIPITRQRQSHLVAVNILLRASIGSEKSERSQKLNVVWIFGAATGANVMDGDWIYS